MSEISMHSHDLPFFSIPLIHEQDIPYSDPASSFWMDPIISKPADRVVRARILSIDKELGLMRVNGLDADININVPFSASHAGSGFYGDVSLPAPGWIVILLQTKNGDYFPLRYIRPFSENGAWTEGIPDELEPGDLGFATKDGGKFFMFENGMLHFESSPNCLRQMSSLDDNERIDDICRRYGLSTDAGSFRFDEYEESPLQQSAMILEASERMSSTPTRVASATFGSLDRLGAKAGLSLQVFSAAESVGKLEMLKTGESTLQAKVKLTLDSARVNLGNAQAVEPVALGNSLESRLAAIESKLNALIATFNLHTHIVPGGAADPTKTVVTAYTNPVTTILSKIVFTS